MRFAPLAALALLIAGCSDDHKKQNTDAGVDAPPDGALSGPMDVTCETLTPSASGTCDITPGGTTTVIKGTVLTPQTVYHGGQVAIDATGLITCVGCNCAQGGETV